MKIYEDERRKRILAPEQPSVLYVGDGEIGYKSSVGFVLGSIYASYPASHITQYSPLTTRQAPIGNFVRVRKFSESPLAELFRLGILGVLVLRRILGFKNPSYISTVPCKRLSFADRIYANLTALSDTAPVRLSRKTALLLKRRNPLVIHALIGDVRTTQRALKLSKRLNLPVVPFITDDWPTTIFLNGELFGRARVRALKKLDQLIERSPVLLVTGEVMAREYSERYKRDCFIAAASVDPIEFSEEYTPHAGRKRLVCVGSPFIGRAELADQVAKYAKKRDWDVIIYPVGFEAWRTLSSEVKIQNQLSSEVVPSVLTKADALLFVESLDPYIAKYTRLSVSGKLMQLIAAARPILAVGPQNQGSMEELNLHANRKILIHDVSQASLSKAFDYLEANLEVAPRHIPQHFLVANLRSTVVRSFNAAIDAWAE